MKLKKMIEAVIARRQGIPDVVKWATSISGLNFPLFPRQKLILKLIAGYANFSGDAQDLARLLDSEDTHAKVWLPANWKFDAPSGRVSCPRPPLIVLLIAGRRSGKTSIASIALAHKLIELSRRKRFPGVKLLRGQTVGAINVAADEQQAKVMFERTIENLRITGTVKQKTPAGGNIRIGRRVLYECLPTSAGAVRGRTAALCALDELAHFPGVRGPASAGRIFDALLPSVRTFGHLGQIIITTSPGGRQGKVWDLYESRGAQDDLLVMQFATWEIHPHITRAMLDTEFSIDPAMASCEYGAQFVAVDSAFLDPDTVAACIRTVERDESIIHPQIPRRIHLDPAFARDRFAIAVAHKDRSIETEIYIDEIRILEPSPGMPLNPSDVESEIASLAKKYRISEVSFDQYCAPYIERQLKRMGLRTRKFDFTSSSKPAIYSNLRSMLALKQISLPDDPELIAELNHLRRIIRPGGFSVAAPTSGRVTTDDIADAVAAVAYLLVNEDTYDGSIIYKPGGYG